MIEKKNIDNNNITNRLKEIRALAGEDLSCEVKDWVLEFGGWLKKRENARKWNSGVSNPYAVNTISTYKYHVMPYL